MVDGIVYQVGESGAKVAKNATPLTMPSTKTKVVSLSANFKIVRDQVRCAKEKFDLFCARTS